ncbi:MAG: ATP-binding protein, partial [Candidatus Zixiibacteriota bacterium]
PGMSKEILKKIYQPFFSTRKTGTGLGLAIVHRIAETLGLELEVESNIGSGTIFELRFKTYQLPGISDLRGAGKSILVKSF